MKNVLRRKIEILVNMNSAAVGKHTQLIQQKLERLKQFSKRVFRVMAIGVTAVTAAAGFLGKSILSTGIQFEKFRIQLGVLFGSAAEGEKKFEWIKAFAKETPYELNEITDAFIRLKATGLAADKDNLLRDLGDLASGAQKPLEQVVMAISNIASGMTGLGMRQLRILNISNEMLEKQGIVFAKNGEVLSNNFDMIQAVQRVIKDNKLSGMMEETAKSVGGILSNLQDAWTQWKAGIADSIFPIIKPDLVRLQDWMGSVIDSGQLDEWATKISAVFKKGYEGAKKWIPKIGIVFKTIVETMVQIFKPITKFFVENPGMVKTALIIVVLTKALKMMKSMALLSESIGIATVGSKLGQKVISMAGVTAGVAATTTATTATAGTAVATGATAAGGLALGTIIPVVLGVLGAAAVGYGIYALIKKIKSNNPDLSERTEKLTAARERLDARQAGSVINSGNIKSIKKMVDEFEKLQLKEKKSKVELDKYNKLMTKLVKIMPDAVTHTDNFGKALGVSTKTIRDGLVDYERFVDVQQRQIEILEKDAITDLSKNFKAFFDQKSYSGSVEQLEMYNKAVAAANQGLSEGSALLIEVGGKTEIVGALSEKAAQAFAGQKKYIEQVDQKMEELVPLASTIFDTNNQASYNRLVAVTDEKFAQLVKRAQNLGKAVKEVANSISETPDTNFGAVAETQEGLKAVEKLTAKHLAALNERALLGQLEQEKAKTEIAQKWAGERQGIFEQYEKGLIVKPELVKLFGQEFVSNLDLVTRIVGNARLAFIALDQQLQSGDIDVSGFGLAGLAEQTEKENVRLSELEKLRVERTAIEQETDLTRRQTYLTNIEALEVAHAQKMEMIRQRPDLTPGQKIELIDEQAALREAEILQERVGEYRTFADQIQNLGQQASDLKLGNFDDFEEYTQQRTAIEEQFNALKLQLDDNEVLSASEKSDMLLKIQDVQDKKLNKNELKMMKLRATTWATGLNSMLQASKLWASGELSLQNALKAGTIQATADTVAGILEAKATEWSAKAIAYAAEGRFGAAAGMTAAALAANIGATFVQAQAQQEIERIKSEAETFDTVEDLESATSEMTKSGYSTQGVTNMYIQPSVSFQNTGTQIIGDSGLEVSAATIGSIAVAAVKDAYETGELGIGTV